MSTRRQFIQAAVCVTGSATVTLLLAPLGSLVAGCSSDEEGSGEGTTSSTNPTIPSIACEGVGARSTVTDGHTHDVCVPTSDLASPPSGGGSYVTTRVEGHSHHVILDAAQLSALERGEVIRVVTTNDAGHMHAYALARSGTLEPTH